MLKTLARPKGFEPGLCLWRTHDTQKNSIILIRYGLKTCALFLYRTYESLAARTPPDKGEDGTEAPTSVLGKNSAVAIFFYINSLSRRISLCAMAVLETARVIEFASVVMLCAARAKGSLEGGSDRLKGASSQAVRRFTAPAC